MAIRDEPIEVRLEYARRAGGGQLYGDFLAEVARLKDALALIAAGTDWAADVARDALLGKDVTGMASPKRTETEAPDG